MNERTEEFLAAVTAALAGDDELSTELLLGSRAAVTEQDAEALGNTVGICAEMATQLAAATGRNAATVWSEMATSLMATGPLPAHALPPPPAPAC